MPKDDVDRLARMFRALGNPHRLRLFMNLLDDSRLDLAGLAVLREAFTTSKVSKL